VQHRSAPRRFFAWALCLLALSIFAITGVVDTVAVAQRLDEEGLPPGFLVPYAPEYRYPPPKRINPETRCPQGYIESPISQRLRNTVICQVDTGTQQRSQLNYCSGRPDHYACGRGGVECCAANQNNLCFPGAFACSVEPGAPGATKTACCIQR
jgi:hypothetical protein